MAIISFSIPGLTRKYVFRTKTQNISSQEKKQIRLKIGTQLPTSYVPLHACLIVKNGEGILLFGPSKSGKSTLAKLFLHAGYHIEANDFVAIIKIKEDLWASDINFQSINAFRSPIKISYIFALNTNSNLDISRMTPTEFKNFYVKSLQPLSRKKVLSLVLRPIFKQIYLKHICLGQRTNPESWFKSINLLINRQPISKIGIFGLGTIGQDLASLLLHQARIDELHIYTNNQIKLSSFVMDLRSAHPEFKITGHNSEENFFQSCDIVVLCFRDDKPVDVPPGTEERMAKILPHAEIIWKISRIIRKQKYTGNILIVSNPVDTLCTLLYHYSQLNDQRECDNLGLRPIQIFGVGLGLDYNRLFAVKPNSKLEVIGPHGEGLLLSTLKNNYLKEAKNYSILKPVLNYSQSIRSGCPRTRIGPVHQIFDVITTLKSGDGILRVSSLNSNGVYLGNILSLKSFIPDLKYLPDKKLQKKLFELSRDQRKYIDYVSRTLTKMPK